MTIDVNDAQPATPPPLDVQDIPNVADAPAVSPPAFDVTVQMAPLTAAGFELVKRVLLLTAGSIVLLVTVLGVAEYRGLTKANETYERAVSEAVNAPASGDNGTNLLLTELQLAQADPSWTMPPAELPGATAALKAIASGPSLTTEQRSALTPCIPIPPPSDSDRASHLEKCVATITQVRPTGGVAAERVKLLEELQKQFDDERQSFRSFWMQIAQMILMNLFFPLITALLGYIFGTQRSGGAT